MIEMDFSLKKLIIMQWLGWQLLLEEEEMLYHKDSLGISLSLMLRKLVMIN
jgi:hypothetical protein